MYSWYTYGRMKVSTLRRRELRDRWAAARALVGCVCPTPKRGRGVKHWPKCPARLPGRSWWNAERKAAQGARAKAAWDALSPEAKAAIGKRLGVSLKGTKWTKERCRAHRLTMRRVWEGWRDGTRPISAAGVAWLRKNGMWPLYSDQVAS